MAIEDIDNICITITYDQLKFLSKLVFKMNVKLY